MGLRQAAEEARLALGLVEDSLQARCVEPVAARQLAAAVAVGVGVDDRLAAQLAAQLAAVLGGCGSVGGVEGGFGG